MLAFAAGNRNLAHLAREAQSGMALSDDGDNGEIAEEPGRDTTARDPRDAELTPAGTGK